MIDEFRRARRRKVATTTTVTDSMTNRAIGNIGNVSETGMLLLASAPLTDDALYQFRFRLPAVRDDGGQGADGIELELGAHLLWLDRASAPGQAWVGFRFIAVPPEQADALRRWINAPGGQFV